ncbi:C2H2 finger domain protein [Dendryphion nanum]|uniref:C2H2 finger domain protein n=1 Tax=Dendryphion nanum TaxID=256645 RepID=A0A9P9DI29_9PLEO|nr:C2H2 finger domain protein [Dendryphion nanum]
MGDVEDQASLFADGTHPPEYYLRQLEAFDEVEHTKEDYKDSSTRLLDRIEEQWNQCWTFIGKDSLRDYSTVSVRSLHTFFNWLLDQRRGKGGRRRCGTKHASSLGTYWKVYRLVFERATGTKIDGKLTRSMHKVMRLLAKKYGLKKIGRDKACMYVEDLTRVLQTNLATTEKRYSHGRHRIQAQLYLQLGGFTANRPRALLGLCYRHIQVTLLRDPEGGPHHILLEFTFEFTKEFLGIKDILQIDSGADMSSRNTFPIPERIYDESLIFSPHVFLLGMLFYDGAFAAYNLTSPEELSKLSIPSVRNDLPLRLNRKLDDTPVFRRADRGPSGWAISDKEPLLYSTLLPWIKALGRITGFRQVARPYSLRYAGGKAFNENGNVKDTMQNLMMGHASIRTFEKHYLSRRITVDTQAVVRGIRPQEALMRAACTMSRTIDPRRPQRLTAEESASVNDLPPIRDLLGRRERLKRNLGKGATQHPLYTDINREINREKQRQRHQLLQDITKRWEYEQPVRDVENQLAGVESNDDAMAAVIAADAMGPEQKELVEAAHAPPGETQQAEIGRRSRAIGAVVAYCGIVEGRVLPSRVKRSHECVATPGKGRDDHGPGPIAVALEAAKVSVYKEKRPTICFVCLGDESVPAEQRLHSFSTSTDLSKHFKRRHLAYIGKAESFTCRLCRICLDGKMHVQRHAHDIHGTVS